MEAPPRLITSGKLATELGVHAQTIRAWERDGFIPAATRRRGRRVYTPEEVARIKTMVFEAPKTQGEQA